MTDVTLLERARALQDQIVAWRRDIHMHPELGFQEFRTSRLVGDALLHQPEVVDLVGDDDWLGRAHEPQQLIDAACERELPLCDRAFGDRLHRIVIGG